MKIESLFVSGFLGVDTVEVHTPEPVQLFAGKNGAGKSSLRDAIALALTADLGRVTLKKEAAKLVRDGFDAAVCEVKDADGDAFTASINAAGKITDNQKGRTEDPVLTYVLDAQRFARLEPNDRRSFLFGLMGVKTDPASVKMRLLSRNCDKDKVERVAPMLRAGFDAASKDAKAKATEAKGAWRAITGETYGSEKAKGWKASVPPHDADAMKSASTELQHCDVALELWQQTIGKLQAQEQRRAGLRAQLPALLEHALRIDRIRAKLDTDQATLKDVTAQVDAVIQQAGNGPRVGLVHDMARAIHAALPAWPGHEHIEAGWQALRDALDAYEAEFGKVGVTGGNADAALRLPELRKALSTAQSAVAHDQRDLDSAQLAKSTADSIETELKEAFDAAALAAAREQADQIKAKRVTVVARLDTLKSIKAQI